MMEKRTEAIGCLWLFLYFDVFELGPEISANHRVVRILSLPDDAVGFLTIWFRRRIWQCKTAAFAMAAMCGGLDFGINHQLAECGFAETCTTFDPFLTGRFFGFRIFVTSGAGHIDLEILLGLSISFGALTGTAGDENVSIVFGLAIGAKLTGDRSCLSEKLIQLSGALTGDTSFLIRNESSQVETAICFDHLFDLMAHDDVLGFGQRFQHSSLFVVDARVNLFLER